MAADSLYPGEEEGGGKSHTHRHAGGIIVILEGMEEVTSQFTIISWSARGVANATYVVWRIFWKSIYVAGP